MNDCMSLWSEEECQNFEEGIQKYGKDFLKIRQHQVNLKFYIFIRQCINYKTLKGTHANHERIGTVLLLMEENRTAGSQFC